MQEGSLAYLLVIVSIALITIASITISYIKNNDLFSPVKMFIFFNIFFYVDIYFNYYNELVVGIYFLQCLVLFIFSLIERPIEINADRVLKTLNQRVIIAIWVLSMVSILNQVSIISELGGVLSYISNIARRVEYFKGKGYVLILNNLIAIMNILYFSLLLSSKNVSKRGWLLFAFHFIVFTVMALLSGSRSFLLMTIMVELLCYHYLFKRLTIAKLAPFVFLILFMIALLGGVRNSFDTSDGVLSVKGGSIEMNSTHFKYGLMPLEIIYGGNTKELSYGMTYISFFTNFIPRSIFPNKLDSGGVVFTKVYTGDRWGGLSNLATGAVTEGVVNFGFAIGSLVGIVSLSLFYLLGIVFYSNLPRILVFKENYIYVVLYIYMLLAFARYSYSEFSYTFYSFVINVALPIVLVVILSRLRKTTLNNGDEYNGRKTD